MRQVAGAQGRALCFPKLKGECHELLDMHGRMLGGGKLNCHVPLPVQVSFYFHGSFLYYLSTPGMLSINMGQLTSSESPRRDDLLSQHHKSCSDAHPPPGFTSLLALGNNGAELPRSQGERSWHPTEQPDLGADPTASTALSQKQVFSCPMQSWQGISARGASEAFLPQNSPFTALGFAFLLLSFFFFLSSFFSVPHRKGQDCMEN